MAYVITDLCTKCMSCTTICPVTCIHPTADEPNVDSQKQVYINPDECIDCGACADECPVSAIFPADELPADKKPCAQANAAYFK